MSSRSRPGGLTAMAVLNFVFGGLGMLGLLGIVAIVFMYDEMKRRPGGEELPPLGVFLISATVSVIAAVLLIVAGIGYIGQKKFLGRMIGNAYAGLSLCNVVFGIAAIGEFGLLNILGLIYPILTLVMVNLVFKDDFINP